MGRLALRLGSLFVLFKPKRKLSDCNTHKRRKGRGDRSETVFGDDSSMALGSDTGRVCEITLPTCGNAELKATGKVRKSSVS